MRWPAIWSSSTLDDRKKEKTVGEKAEDALESVGNATNSSTESLKKQISHTPTTNWQIYTQPQTIIATVVLTSACVGFLRFYRSYLRRIPVAGNISSGFFRRRSILGKVTAVGDGDNFRIYHTPGGWLAGWGWLPWRRVPKEKKDLKDKTIHVRLAGVDAPEMAHFGRPSQPYAQEALDWLTSYLSGRRVRAYVYKVDQYSRVVATVYVWKGMFRRDVGLQMLRAGLATVYEAKTGAEFGKGLEKKYRSAEWWAKAKRKGMWAGKRKDFESPREYKTRYGGATPIQETPKK